MTHLFPALFFAATCDLAARTGAKVAVAEEGKNKLQGKILPLGSTGMLNAAPRPLRRH